MVVQLSASYRSYTPTNVYLVHQSDYCFGEVKYDRVLLTQPSRKGQRC